jgi:hypothetical protein
MGYCNVSVVKRLQAVIVLGAILVVPVQNVGAESNLAAIICDPSRPASLTVVRPQSDSVVNNANIELSGDVAQASQLEIYVDDAYSGVVPLSYNDTHYSTTVSIGLGTHTLKVVAVDVCQVGNASSSVVVTYQNAASASNGNQVPTNVDGSTVNSQEVTSSRNPLEQFVLLPLLGLAQSLDLIAYDSAATGNIDATNVLRFVIISAALVMLFYSTRLAHQVVLLMKQLKLIPSVTAVRQRNLRKVILGIGIGVIILVFMV